MKNSPEIIRAHFLPFFNNAAADLANLMDNLNRGRFSHVKGTITRGATSLNYVHMVLLPVLSSFFEHLGHNSYGNDILGMTFFFLLFSFYNFLLKFKKLFLIFFSLFISSFSLFNFLFHFFSPYQKTI